MATKSKYYFLRLSLACLIIAAVGIFIESNRRSDKKQKFSPLISELESYKVKHGSYPPNLGIIGISVDEDVCYSVDSTRTNFNLAYTEGIMGVNTVSYNSTTRKWEKRFNY